MIHTLPKSLRRIQACRKMPSIRPKCPGHLKKTAVKLSRDGDLIKTVFDFPILEMRPQNQTRKAKLGSCTPLNFAAAANIAWRMLR